MAASANRARLVVGAIFVLVGALAVAYPLWWNARSNAAGSQLLAQADARILNAKSVCPTSTASAAAPGRTPGIIEIPSLGLVAPVLDGLTDSVLNVAVGHVPGAPWPGAPGEAMVEAHDVSYFANLRMVRPGQTVVWVTPCLRAQFRIVAGTVSSPGQVVDTPSSGSGLALVTCYPTNALWWTPKRYVVTTQLVSAKVGPQALPKVATGAPKLDVPVPPALSAEGLALSQNQLVLGVMQFNGHPNAAWTEGPGPLAVEADALDVFFGAEKSIESHNASWWHAITIPGLALPTSWPTFGPGAANITIGVSGSSPVSVTVASPAASATIVIQHNVVRLAKLS